MAAPRSQDLLVKAARLFYLENKSQGEVATELGLSRSSVSRILAAAREQGVVEIRIHVPGAVSRISELEDALRRCLGVKNPIVVARPRGKDPIELVAQAAARLFEERVAHLSSFGLSWGHTLDRFVEEVEPEPIHRSLEICPLAGGLPSDTGPAGNTSLELLAARTGATHFRFESPAVVESRGTWAALTRESSIVNAVTRASQVELAFVGVGAYGHHNSAQIVAAMRFTAEETRELESLHPVGDISGRYFNLDGEPLGLPISERVVGLSLDQIAAIPEVIGIAAGIEKAPGVVGALRTQTLDGIIVDEELAQAVLRAAA